MDQQHKTWLIFRHVPNFISGDFNHFDFHQILFALKMLIFNDIYLNSVTTAIWLTLFSKEIFNRFVKAEN